MATVTLTGVSKAYDAGRPAVDNIDVEIASGEFFTLLGPSGCGKTTTLRIIAGFETPTAGSVHFAGRDVTSLAPEKRGAGMVFQNYALFPHLTVGENVAYGLAIRKVRGRDRSARVRDALARVGLDGYEKRSVADLSGGQQQRVALARAIVIEPEVLLLDEPLSNLDARLRDETRVQVKQIQEQSAITAVYVTHDQSEAMAVSDRIAVLEEGKVHQIGTPREIYNRPRTAFVARFIGRSNLVDAVVDRVDGARSTVRLPNGSLVEAVSEGVQAPSGVPVLLSLRPEVLRLTADEDPVLSGIVRSVEFLGASTLVGVEAESGQLIIVSVAEGPHGSARAVPGERVGIAVDPAHSWLVPA